MSPCGKAKIASNIINKLLLTDCSLNTNYYKANEYSSLTVVAQQKVHPVARGQDDDCLGGDDRSRGLQGWK